MPVVLFASNLHEPINVISAFSWVDTARVVCGADLVQSAYFLTTRILAQSLFVVCIFYYKECIHLLLV